MMEQKAGEDEIAEKAASRKRSSAIDDGAADAGFSDDVIGNILARQPARAAVACTALSKRHRRLIRSPEFTDLHRRLAPPLPRPHVAYVTNAPARQRKWLGRVSDFHGFYVAGAGLRRSAATPMRALAGGRYLRKQYINTCNGVVLLAGDREIKSKNHPARCVLWNPAVADDDKEVAVPCPWKGSYRILGFGYVPRSKTYKLLLWRRWRLVDDCEPATKKRYSMELLVYTLGDGQDQQLRSLMVFPEGRGGAIITESFYLDGTIYILDNGYMSSAIIAFDVDDETVTIIDMPGEHDPTDSSHARSKLMEMSGRLCVVTNHGRHRVALWLLTVDRHWEQRCVIGNEGDIVNKEDEGSVDRCFIAGVWDFGSVLAMYLDFRIGDYNKLCTYNVESEKMIKADLPRDLTPEREDFAFCWGYKPTLVSPGSITGELSQDESRRDGMVKDITEPLKLANERDKQKGHEETMEIVSFMDFMVGIMGELPDNMPYGNANAECRWYGFLFRECIFFKNAAHSSDKLVVRVQPLLVIAYLNLFIPII